MLDSKIIDELRAFISLHETPLEASFTSYKTLESNLELDIEDFIKTKKKPVFKEVLFRFIDERKTSDSEIYKKAQMDRKHFSKIRTNVSYRPGKNTIIALALALELTIEDTETLLGSAGYSLSDSEYSDLVVQFCIERKIYNLNEVNYALDQLNLKPIG
ncbi:hypothetical protein [Bacillus alkalicellulosilyticus]|uniref:hypothetical protein n=1 Tax=Alkalihalobacterium alkalicellulosilyticum TaxID=1912214 RepID=UPI000998CC67|nr:hypothetical protein [Bacillus alkalicellulosilyticus]